MTARFLAWWRERSRREQRLLLVMFALLAVTFVWLAVYRPIQGALSHARERQQQAAVQLGEVRAQADALRMQPPAVPTGSLATLVMQAANDAGFANAAIAPQGDRRATLSISSARSVPFLAWIAALETRGIVVERLSARANNDATLAIDATMTGGG